MKHTLLLFVLALTLGVAACGDKKGPATGKDSTGAKTSEKTDGGSTSDAGNAGGKIYGVESGMMEMENSMMKGMKMIIYWDDYGAKQAVHTTGEMAGQKMDMVQITAGGYNVTYDVNTKMGSKSKADKPVGAMTEFLNMSDERKKALNYKELGTKEILGKEAEGFSIDSAGQSVTFYVWESIPLAMDVKGGSMALTMNATKIDTDTEVPASMFEAPADVKITEGGAAGGPMGGSGGNSGGTPPPGGSETMPADSAKK